jgi:hypothetical protein
MTVKVMAAAIDRGKAVRDRVIGSEWPAGGRNGIIWALSGLIDALETYELVRDHAMCPSIAFPELEHTENAWPRALAMAAQDASAWASELDRLVPVGQLIGEPAVA